jgi:hypothetical protein
MRVPGKREVESDGLRAKGPHSQSGRPDNGLNLPRTAPCQQDSKLLRNLILAPDAIMSFIGKNRVAGGCIGLRTGGLNPLRGGADERD